MRRTAWRRCCGWCVSRAGARRRSSAQACPRIVARTLDLGSIADRHSARSIAARALLVAYARGVNAHLERIRDEAGGAGREPSQRSPLELEAEDSLAVLQLYAWASRTRSR
jgi:acyl-homoserine lactone acylase PvdQ